MSDNMSVDADAVINQLLATITSQAKELAVTRALLAQALSRQEPGAGQEPPPAG
jgi:hypothetical protein